MGSGADGRTCSGACKILCAVDLSGVEGVGADVDSSRGVCQGISRDLGAVDEGFLSAILQIACMLSKLVR